MFFGKHGASPFSNTDAQTNNLPVQPVRSNSRFNQDSRAIKTNPATENLACFGRCDPERAKPYSIFTVSIPRNIAIREILFRDNLFLGLRHVQHANTTDGSCSR